MRGFKSSLLTLGAMVTTFAALQLPGHVDRNWNDRDTLSLSADLAPCLSYERLLVDADPADWAQIASDHRLQVVDRLPDLETMAVLVGPQTRAALAADSRIRTLSRDQDFEIAGACCGSGDARLDPAAFERARAELEAAYGPLRSLPQRREVLLAVLDTGIEASHPDLENHDAGRSFVPGERWDHDANGHGTAMASLAAGGGHDDHDHQQDHEEEVQSLGVAPAARILPVQVADRRGRARASQVAAGITWAADQGADVILIALGSREPSQVVASAVAYAEERGALIVAAAGNENTHSERYPAADPRVISVGALDRDGSLAYTTAFAPTTDLLAPGTSQLAAALKGGYAHVTGTSAAAARSAGLLALAKAARPRTSPETLRGIVRGARRSHFQDDLARTFPAGPVEVSALREVLERPAPRLLLSGARVLPTHALPKTPVTLSVRVRNGGLQTSATDTVAVRLGEQLFEVEVPALAPGAEVTLTSKAQASPGRVEFSLGEVELSCELLPQRAETYRDRAVAGLRSEEQRLIASLEGRGATALGGTLVARLAGRELARAEVAPLAGGELREVSLELPRDLPAGIQQVEVAFLEADDAPESDRASFDLCLRSEREVDLTTQYQQSGLVNVVSDTPWRLAPGRAWLPVLVFVPEKGDLDPNTALQLSRVTFKVRTVANTAASAQTVYEDTVSGIPFAPAGLEIVDEYGNVQTTGVNGGAADQRLFQHQPVAVPGRYAIVRVPRAAFGLSGSGQDEVRYLEVQSQWRLLRGFQNSPRTIKTGSTSKVMEVRFAGLSRPQLQGGGGYYDAHVHTVAEWYQDQSFDALAPRKNWGGPLPMLAEGAFAVGMIDSLSDVKDRVVTTDHNAFYNDGDGFRDRPLWGPTSVNASGGKSEWERMGELYGIARGEEVAFASTTQINPLLNLPLGAHALTYRATHVEGPWHGGSSFARTLGDTSPDLNLAEVLRQLTQTSPQQNAKAALYAAHPFASSNGWTEEHLEIAFERDSARRTDRTVKLGEHGFVTKGLQIWNGEFGRHQLPTRNIDWDRVNPYTNSDYLTGNPDWDQELIRGLRRWHRDSARLLNYELAGLPGVRFPRKMFISAGSDAHGDFNLTEDRLATMFDVNATFLLDRSAFGRVMTYSLPPQGAGATREDSLEAMLDGNSVLTDGPLLRIDLDAEDRFDGRTLRWSEQAPDYRDADGRIGGGGAYDGEGTALVRRGSANARIGYRYSSTPEWGEVRSIVLHRTSSGDPNPTSARSSGGSYLAARGRLATRGADLLHSEPLDANEEGLIVAPTAISAAAYTGGDVAPGVDDGRCITNAVYAVPFDAEALVGQVEVDSSGRGEIPAGQLVVRFDFDMSLEPADYQIEIKALDAQGVSSDATVGPIDVLASAGGTGWANRSQIRDSTLTVVNQRPIPLDLERFGGADEVTFVIYFYERPRDAFGNSLNRIAFTFKVQGAGQGGGTGPSVDRATGVTSAASTAAPTQPGAGGSSGGGGCTLSAAQGSSELPWLPLLALLSTLALWRLRR
jgi:subtilase family protein